MAPNRQKVNPRPPAARATPPPRATPPERQSPPKPGTVDRGTLAPGTLFQPPGLAGAGPNKIGELPPGAPPPGLLPAAAKAPASPPEIRVLRQTAAPREGEQPAGEAAKGSQGKGGPAGARTSSKEEDGFLPVSIISGTLLTGMDAATGKGARADPIPILLRVKHEAILPNRFTVDIRECFLIASGYGDLSSERAYLRAENLSCVRDDGGVIETTLEAYAVGEDGKAGIRGRLVSKQGAVLARAMQAGFLEAFASMFRQQPVATISTGRVERDVQYQSNLTPQAVGSAALAGVGSALDRLAQFYLDMAEDMFPVIEVDAGRQIDFIVHRGQRLRLTERAH